MTTEEKTTEEVTFLREGIIIMDGEWTNVAKALLACQKAWKPPRRTKMGQTRSQKHSYAPLEEVLASVRPMLTENGIALIGGASEQEPRVLTVETWLLHPDSGGRIGSISQYPCPGETPKDRGGAETYARRYAILHLLGLQPEDEDDDGTAVSDRADRTSQKAAAAPKPPPEAPPNSARIRTRKGGEGLLVETDPDKHAAGDRISAWSKTERAMIEITLTTELNASQKNRERAYWLFTKDQP